MSRPKPPWCDCPTRATLGRVIELYRRTYWRSFFSRRSRRMLERCQLSMGRMMRRRYSCWYHEEILREIRMNSRLAR